MERRIQFAGFDGSAGLSNRAHDDSTTVRDIRFARGKHMIRPSLVLIALLVAPVTTLAQTASSQPSPRPNPLNTAPQEIPLWEGQAPGALGSEDVDRPTLTIYRAARAATGTGVVVAPGGGYGALAMDYEGRQVAAYFNAMGVSAFVLKYRLGPRYHHPSSSAMRSGRCGSCARARRSTASTPIASA